MRERANPSSLVPCVAIVLALLAGGAAAQQPSFTFNVPVRLQQVHHDVERIRVTCAVSVELCNIRSAVRARTPCIGTVSSTASCMGVARAVSDNWGAEGVTVGVTRSRACT